jgi:muramoyltetrapeptide carboxypeptidase
VTIKPPRLEPGGTIGIIAPAGPVRRKDIQPAIDLLHRMGYPTLSSPNIYKKTSYLAGRDEDRLNDLHAMFKDSSVKAIFCARGGYGAGRLLDRIDYDLILNNPKILTGYSDITALLLAVMKKTNLVTFHGPVLRDLSHDPKNNLKHLIKTLSSNGPRSIELSKRAVIKEGQARGKLLGGNLSLISSLIGTPFMPRTKGAILFLEDKGEPIYRIDRMLTHLKNSGIIHGITGLIAGSFTDCGGMRDINKLLKDFTSDLDIPVINGLPVGHDIENKTIPMGINVEFDTKDMILSLLESYVT